ncbi:MULTISPECIES: hypothetical protein [Spirulina sp. CCY15215]|nr:hypothetical protein [Spirulina major]
MEVNDKIDQIKALIGRDSRKQNNFVSIPQKAIAISKPSSEKSDRDRKV